MGHANGLWRVSARGGRCRLNDYVRDVVRSRPATRSVLNTPRIEAIRGA